MSFRQFFPLRCTSGMVKVEGIAASRPSSTRSGVFEHLEVEISMTCKELSGETFATAKVSLQTWSQRNIVVHIVDGGDYWMGAQTCTVCVACF